MSAGIVNLFTNGCSDDFAIQVLKLDINKKFSTLVHSYALAGTALKDHIFYFHYILTNFNVVGVCADYNGSVQFISACNESELFKSSNLHIHSIEVDFEKPQEYEIDLMKLRNLYNLAEKRILILRKPTSSWIRQGNEILQAAFDHKRIYFAAAAMDDSYHIQSKKIIPIEKLKFIKADDYIEEKEGGARMIDFVEHQADMINLTKSECALIQIQTSAQGLQTFDLPLNLKKLGGSSKTRKDSYSALVLGNWMVKIFYDMKNDDFGDAGMTFEPMLI